MQLLSTPDQISKTLCSLIKKYSNIQLASAWASHNSIAFDALKKHAHKIKRSCIGIHFYQTHPEFIKSFLNNDNMKFKEDPVGIFHPKVYLFSNSQKEWECVIGSANFTRAAMKDNTEVMIHFSNQDLNANEIYQQLTQEIDGYWELASVFNREKYEKYRSTWSTKLKLRSRLADQYAENSSGRPVYMSNIMTLTWQEFYTQAKKDVNNAFYIRLELLNKSQNYFETSTFEKMPLLHRQQISGIVKADEENSELDWRLFGTVSSPRFKNRISDAHSDISKALECIPLEGDVTKEQYMAYIKYFQKYTNYGYGLTSVTRFLAMKRPDTFFCVTGANSKVLYRDFGIKEVSSKKEYERYWDDIVERIKESKWWNTNTPEVDEELKLWNNRAAMLDAILYEDILFTK